MPKLELTLKQGDRTVGSYHLLQPGEYILGRDPSCAVLVEDSEMSRQHARLTIEPDRVRLEDLGSANGTFVDGQRIQQTIALQFGERIQLGSTMLHIRALEEGPPEVTAAPRDAATVPDPDQTIVAPRQTPRVVEQKVRAEVEFNVGQEVAHGGMGSVLSARDLGIGRTVAMKVMRVGREGAPELEERFRQEAQLTGQLEHPNIVPVHELGRDEQGRTFYTMKFVKGVSLHEVLDKIKAGDPTTIANYPLAALLTIFQKVCDAMGFAHSRGVVHRDLKPANIMIGEYGEVLVMDWGLAKVVGASERRSVEALERQSVGASDEVPTLGRSDALTLAGQVMGTPQFMAPEQAMGKVEEIDARSDLFSLGAILYNILTLHPPVTGETVNEILQKIRAGEIAHPSAYNPKSSKSRGTKANVGGASMPRPPLFPLRHCPGGRVPDSLSAVTMKALALKKEDRYQNVVELQKDIEAYQGGFATTAENAGAVKLIWLMIKRHKIEAAAAMIILVLVTGFMIKVIASERRATATLTALRATAPTYHAQALALIKERKFKEALEKISYAVAIRPEEADYHYLKGNMLQSLLRLPEARDAYAETLQRKKDHVLAKENLELCEKIIQQNPGGTQLAPASRSELQAAMRRQGRFEEALAVLDSLQAGGQKAFEAWNDVLTKAGYGGSLRLQDDGTLKLNFASSSIRDPDLLRIKGMPVTSLDLRGARVSNLEPLRGMPLRELWMDDCDLISDFRPLQSMPLEVLRLNRTQFRDLSLLKGMRLRNLELGKLPISDLTPLKGMPLELLNIQHTQVTDLSPLQGMPLYCLLLSDLNVTDLSPLSGMPLRELWLEYTPVSDLGPLKGMPLTILRLNSTNVTDLSPLKGAPLRELRLLGTGIRDLTPLVDCPALECLKPPVDCKEIEFLRRHPRLQRISYGDENCPSTATAAEFWKEYDAKKRKEGGR